MNGTQTLGVPRGIPSAGEATTAADLTRTVAEMENS